MTRTLVKIAGLAIFFGFVSAPKARADTRFSLDVGVPAPVIAAPYADDVYWQPGHYVWNGYTNVWVRGAWVRRAHDRYDGDRWAHERWERERRERWEREHWERERWEREHFRAEPRWDRDRDWDDRDQRWGR